MLVSKSEFESLLRWIGDGAGVCVVLIATGKLLRWRRFAHFPAWPLVVWPMSIMIASGITLEILHGLCASYGAHIVFQIVGLVGILVLAVWKRAKKPDRLSR